MPTAVAEDRVFTGILIVCVCIYFGIKRSKVKVMSAKTAGVGLCTLVSACFQPKFNIIIY